MQYGRLFAPFIDNVLIVGGKDNAVPSHIFDTAKLHNEAKCAIIEN